MRGWPVVDGEKHLASEGDGDWQPVFLAALRKQPNVLKAARAAGVSRVMAYRVRKESPEFAAKWEEAVMDAIDNIEGIAMDLAKLRDPKHNNLRMFMLRAHMPDVYGDKSEVRLRGEIEHEHRHTFDFSRLSNTEFDELDGLMLKLKPVEQEAIDGPA